MSRAVPPLAVWVALLACAPAARAAAPAPDTEVPEILAAAPRSKEAGVPQQPGRQSAIEADSTALPAVAPLRWTSSAELTGHSYRWSLSRGALDIAMRFDAPRSATGAEDFSTQPPTPIGSNLPAISVGWRLPTPSHALAASTLLERAMDSARAESYGNKIGVEWKPAESQVNFLREGLGIRLDGNNRMTVRLRKGLLGLYMHRKF